jgi:hypothetical protein
MFRFLSAILLIVVFSLFGLPDPASAAGPATIISPTNGSTLSGPTVTFSWNTGVGVSQYFLYVGTSVGANNLYGQSIGLGLSATVTGLPTNGSTIYVELCSLLATGWQSNFYRYRAATATAGAPAAIISPTNGSTLSGPTVTFSWNTGVGVSQYVLYVGTAFDTYNLYDQSLGLGLSATVTGLPTNGSTIYVRLWSDLPSGWQSNDYTYTAAKIGGFLTFPLHGCSDSACTINYTTHGAYSAGAMNSVLDHSMALNPSTQYYPTERHKHHLLAAIKRLKRSTAKSQKAPV